MSIPKICSLPLASFSCLPIRILLNLQTQVRSHLLQTTFQNWVASSIYLAQFFVTSEPLQRFMELNSHKRMKTLENPLPVGMRQIENRLDSTAGQEVGTRVSIQNLFCYMFEYQANIYYQYVCVYMHTCLLPKMFSYWSIYLAMFLGVNVPVHTHRYACTHRHFISNPCYKFAFIWCSG